MTAFWSDEHDCSRDTVEEDNEYELYLNQLRIEEEAWEKETAQSQHGSGSGLIDEGGLGPG